LPKGEAWLTPAAIDRTGCELPAPGRTLPLYASTKGAIETLVKNWAALLGPRRVRVNAVAPGVIETDMSNFTKTEAGREVTLGMQALKRIGKPDDVADVIVFLASDKARWITGRVFQWMGDRNSSSGIAHETDRSMEGSGHVRSKHNSFVTKRGPS
jgi:NAD(P)-dependent dehydrogenase (short-subunit alcohol dehydrogenase family)